MPNSPKHGHPVLLIESYTRIDEQKSPFLLLTVGIPHVLHCRFNDLVEVRTVCCTLFLEK
jgi:hypothetical protein